MSSDKIGTMQAAQLRNRAIHWLRTDLNVRTKQLDDGKSDDRATVAPALVKWQQEPDLATLRDSDAVQQLPADEQVECRRLWADVAALLQKAAPLPK
jgi:serine/threonine-protein kinase